MRTDHLEHLTTRGRRRAAVRRRRAHAGERGAVLVEAVFIVPVLLMLVFGMVTYGVALSQGNAIENAAREASRFGSTRPVGGATLSWLNEVTAVAVAASSGDLDASASGRYICVALVGAGAQSGRLVTTGSSAGVHSTSGACPESSASGAPDLSCLPGKACVQVVLERSAKLEAVAFQRTVTLRGHAVTAYEREL